MLAEANIRRLWPQRHEGRYVRAILRQSIRDAQAWKRMGEAPAGLLTRPAPSPAPPPVIVEQVVAAPPDDPQEALF